VRDTTLRGGGISQTMYIYNPVRTSQETLRSRYKARPVNAVYCEDHTEHTHTHTHTHTLCGQMQRFLLLEQVFTVVLQRV
jgi:hypothetical protein